MSSRIEYGSVFMRTYVMGVYYQIDQRASGLTEILFSGEVE